MSNIKIKKIREIFLQFYKKSYFDKDVIYRKESQENFVLKDKKNDNQVEYPINVLYEFDVDDFGRLISYSDLNSNQKFYYRYNNENNIINFEGLEYEYENGILISIDNNPLTYTNKYFLHTYLGKTYNWTNNRLTSYNDGNTTYYYEYDYKGLRRKKIYNNEIIDFYYDKAGRLLREKYNRNDIIVNYHYKGNEIMGFLVGNKNYYYIKQNNIIIGVKDMNGLIFGKYYYSPYGKIIYSYEDDSIKGLNHFKYKSYYYDDESNMYYLKTRYYLPSIGRFISPNIVVDKISYTYCSNNPIDYSDSTGEY